MPKSRGRTPRSKQPPKRTLRVVDGEHRTDSSTEAVLDSAIELLGDYLGGDDEAIWPVFAEASIAQLLSTIDTTLADPTGEPGDAARRFWSDAARILGGRRDLDSGVLLSGLSRLAGPAGRLPLQRAWQARRKDWVPPAFVDRVGDFALTGAMTSTDASGDGCSVVLEYDDETHPHTLVVFIDNNLGGMVKDVFIGPPRKVVEDTYLYGAGVAVGPERPEAALGLILRGMAITMDTEDPPVADSFDFYAGLLMTRIEQMNLNPVFPPEPPGLTGSERDQLARRFARSSYAEGLGLPGPVVVEIARLWIDHAVDYTVGGPLRISPILVQLFLVDWVPRKLADPGPVPVVTKAWLAFAAAERRTDPDLLAEALAAVDLWTRTGSG